MRDMQQSPQVATSLRRGTLEFCVLALLSGRDRYGIEIVETLAHEMALTTSEGTLYPMLSRLRRSGWVTTTWRESPVGPPRRYYTLTPEGRAALAQFREQWVVFRDAVDRIVRTEQP